MHDNIFVKKICIYYTVENRIYMAPSHPIIEAIE